LSFRKKPKTTDKHWDKQGWRWCRKGRVTKKWLPWLPDGYQKSKIQKRRKMLAVTRITKITNKIKLYRKKNSKMAIRLMLMRGFSFFLSKFLVKNGNPLNADAGF